MKKLKIARIPNGPVLRWCHTNKNIVGSTQPVKSNSNLYTPAILATQEAEIRRIVV
jgi:hypothetical protein